MYDITCWCFAGQIAKCAGVLKPSGHLSHIMNHGTDQEALKQVQQGGGPSACTILVKPNGAQLQEVLELLAAGKVKLEVAKVSLVSLRRCYCY